MTGKTKPSAKATLLCPRCPTKTRAYKTFIALGDHLREAHKDYHCLICGQELESAKVLYHHYQRLDHSSLEPSSMEDITTVPELLNHLYQRHDSSLRVLPPSQDITPALGRRHGHSPQASSPIPDINPVFEIMERLYQRRDNPPELPPSRSITAAPQDSMQYIILTPEEYDFIFEGLLARCHPSSRLRRSFNIPSVAEHEEDNETKENGLVRQGIPVDGTSEPTVERSSTAQRKTGQSDSNVTVRTNKTNNKKVKKRHALSPHLFRAAPPRLSDVGHGKRKAVALDCEMVETTDCYSELAYLSAVDVLTGEVLIDSFVKPPQTVICWRSAVSGVTPKNMREAVRRGQALDGWWTARKKLWEVVDEQTVLVGHALQNDLSVLGITHRRVVDSAILTAEAVYLETKPDEKLPRVWGLKNLTKELLGKDIQTGKKGHSALQDAYASRDIVVSSIRTPEILRKWAVATRKEEERKHRASLKSKEKALEKQLAAVRAQLEALAASPQDSGCVLTGSTLPN